MIRALASPAGLRRRCPGRPRGRRRYVHPASLYCSLGGITNLAIARGSTCLFSRVAQFSVRGIAEDLAAATGLPLEHAEQWLAPRRSRYAARPRSRATRRPRLPRSALEGNSAASPTSFASRSTYYGAQEGAAPVEDIFLCGWGSAIPGSAERIDFGARPTGDRSRRRQRSSGFPDGEAARLTLPYGLALES